MPKKFRLLFIPLICGATSTLLFLLQGGFGAGHGKLDPIISLLSLPWTLPWIPYDQIPFPAFIDNHDILLIVWVPAFLNFMLIYFCLLIISQFKKTE